MKDNSKTIIGIAIGIFILGGIILVARPSPSSMQSANPNSRVTGMLAAEETIFNFGNLSMVGGKVSHRFKIKNTGDNPTRIEKMYTSCMCTSAKLIMSGNSFGPFGMPGHGFIPRINKTLAPNEEAIVEVEFDPAAHGPAGIGRIERVVYLEDSGGKPLEFKISAMVTP